MVALTGLLVGIGIREELIDNADEVAEVRAEQLAELASQGLLPARIAEADEFEAGVQVVRGHQVISSTSKAAAPGFFGLPPEPAGSTA